MDVTWLKQKLAQNGFTLKDLADQTGLPLCKLEKAVETQNAKQSVWNAILDVMNDYPAVRYPSAQILNDLAQDVSSYGEEALCLVYYGVNQNELVFCEYQSLTDMEMHGANVGTTFLSTLKLTLGEAQELFTRQNFTIES